MTPERGSKRTNIGSKLEPIQPVLFDLPQTPSEVKERKHPQPRRQPVFKMNEARINDYLDMRQKGKLSDWLRSLDFDRNEVLSAAEVEVINSYLFPQDGLWYSQKEILARLGLPKGNTDIVRKIALSGLIKICRRDVYGEEALEVLGLPSFQYRRLVEAGVCTFDDFARLNSKLILQICPQKGDLVKFQEVFESRGYYWNPQVEY